MKTAHWSLSGTALLLALTTVSVRADEAEDKAVKAIKKLGGSITCDETATDKPIVVVDLSSTKVTGKGKADLKKALPELIVQGK